MNVKYHVACGVVMDLYFGTKGLMTLFSVLPDSPLILNEIRIRKEKIPFKAEEVPDTIFFFYMYFHSLIFTSFIGIWFGKFALIAWAVHIVADWFTHTGRFSAMPFFPFSHYQIKFGREILK